MGPKVERFFWLDWMRFVAAFMVLLYHVRGSHFVEYGALAADSKGVVTAAGYAVTRLGPEAVILFFVLSGFLVGGKAIERVRLGGFNWRQFALDRCTRVMMPLLPTIGVTMLIGWWVNLPCSWGEAMTSMIGLQGILMDAPKANQALWSLAYETWFYVVAGAVGGWVMGRSLWLGLLAMLGVVLLAQLHLAFTLCWVAGAICYEFDRAVKLGSWRVCTALALISAGLLVTQFGQESRSGAMLSGLPPRDIGMLLIGLGVASVMKPLSLAQPSVSWMAKLERLGVPMADFSFSLYLIHAPILLAWDHMAGSPRMALDAMTMGLAVGKVALCLALAFGFACCFEYPTNGVRGYLKRKLQLA
jgi:peptidoglycan/LPS O-acetylase OafA/YrhL